MWGLYFTSTLGPSWQVCSVQPSFPDTLLVSLQPSHSWATAIQSWQHGIPQRWPLDHPVEQHSLRRKANLPLSGELRFTGNSHDWLGFPGLFDIALALTPRSPHQPFQPPLSARDGAKPGQLKKNPSIVSVVRNPFKSMGHCLWLSP